MAYNPFTPEEDAALLRLEASGLDWKAIAAQIPGRLYRTLRSRHLLITARIPARPARAAKRSCLRCRDVFDSDGPGNRICEPCGKGNSHIRDFGQPVHTADGPGLIFGRGYGNSPGAHRG